MKVPFIIQVGLCFCKLSKICSLKMDLLAPPNYTQLPQQGTSSCGALRSHQRCIYMSLTQNAQSDLCLTELQPLENLEQQPKGEGGGYEDAGRRKIPIRTQFQLSSPNVLSAEGATHISQNYILLSASNLLDSGTVVSSGNHKCGTI